MLQPSGEVCPVERDALFFRLEKEVCENDESAVWKRSIPHLLLPQLAREAASGRQEQVGLTSVEVVDTLMLQHLVFCRARIRGVHFDLEAV